MIPRAVQGKLSPASGSTNVGDVSPRSVQSQVKNIGLLVYFSTRQARRIGSSLLERGSGEWLTLIQGTLVVHC
jgi:hypothetical protein